MCPTYPFKCECGYEKDVMKPMSECSAEERCDLCGKSMARSLAGCGQYVIGTRDSFGIGNSFYDETTKTEIDTWGKWEKAGYKDAVESTKNHDVREKVKRKIDKVNFEKGKHFTV